MDASLHFVESRDFRLASSPPIVIGVDVGQKRDPTAIAVIEAFRQEAPGQRHEYRFETRILQRLPLGTPYPDVAERLAELVANLANHPVAPNHAAPPLAMLIDATGVGGPVVDLMRNALRGSRCRLTPVVFVHGERLTTVNRELRMGKEYLVSRLTALMQTRRVKLPEGHPEIDAMVQELLDYEIKTSDAGKATFGAFRTGAHDDLATALGLAVLRDPGGAGVWGT